MHILIRKSLCPTLKTEIRDMINGGVIKTWEFILEDERYRLVHADSKKQYDDVVLRFINSSRDGQQYIRIEPFIRLGVTDEETAVSHFGIVLGRFAELLNCHFEDIGSYETIL